MIFRVKTGQFLSFFGILMFWLRDCHESEAEEIVDFSTKNRAISVIVWRLFFLGGGDVEISRPAGAGRGHIQGNSIDLRVNRG